MCCGYSDHLDMRITKKLILLAILDLQIMLTNPGLTSCPLKTHIVFNDLLCLITLFKKTIILVLLRCQEAVLRRLKKFLDD